MHIGFLSPEYVTPNRLDGGLANYLSKVGRLLTSRGHDVTILVLSNRNLSWLDDGVRVIEIRKFVELPRPARYRHLMKPIVQILNSQRLAEKVWQAHHKSPFDILQASSYLAPGYILRRNPHVPVVTRASSYTPLLRSAYGYKRNLGEYLSDWLEIRQVLDVASSFAPSEFLSSIFERFEGCRLAVIRTPITTITSAEADPSFYDDALLGKRYVLFVGTLSQIKGVDLIARIIPEILGSYPDLHFVFIGRDDGLPSGQLMLDHIHATCGKWADHIVYNQALPKSKLYPVIKSALGVLMPSRVDNYPNVCLEAFACEVPVVAANNSSLEEMVVEGETGFLACNGDVNSLRQAVERLLTQTPIQRAQMQARLRATVSSMQVEDRVGQLIAFYESVMTNFQPDN